MSPSWALNKEAATWYLAMYFSKGVSSYSKIYDDKEGSHGAQLWAE